MFVKKILSTGDGIFFVYVELVFYYSRFAHVGVLFYNYEENIINWI